LEIVRSHPTNKDEQARTDVAANIAILRFIRSNVDARSPVGYGAYPVAEGRGQSCSFSTWRDCQK
jgi:hypothetical protein